MGRQAVEILRDIEREIKYNIVLAFLDLQQPFKIQTDVSGYGMGDVLIQRGNLFSTILKHLHC